MSSSSNPYWYKLIKLLKTKGEITTGLTIPYLFGAYKELGQPVTNIKELIKHIYYSEIDKYPLIQRCDVIEHHVVTIEEKAFCSKSYKNDIKFKNPTNNNILFIVDTDLGTTLDKVCSSLSLGYANQIKSQEYSWSKKEKRWKKFEPSEIKMILSIE